MHGRLALSAVAVFAIAFIGGACSDEKPAASASSSASSSGSGAEDAGEPTIPVEQCNTRCGAKVTGCGGPPAACGQFCTAGVTESQASCLEIRSCDELVQAFLQGTTFEALCSRPPQSSSSASSSGGDGLPVNVTIKGTIPSGYTPKHVSVSGKIVSLFDVAVKPTIAPPAPAGQLPLISNAKERATIDSPSAGSCDVAFSFTLNAGEVGVHMEGTDDGAANDCGSFTDEAAKNGAKLTLKDVPWPNSITKSTVTIELE